MSIQTALRFLNPKLHADYAGDFVGVVAVVTVPFNRYLAENRPDDTNRQLADMSMSWAEKLHICVIGQWEQTNLIPEYLRIQYPKASGKGEWVKTNELMEWIVKTVRIQGRGNRIILIMHPHHARRGSILARHYGLDPLVPLTVQDIPYDPNHHTGYQWWCTGPWVYIPWEYCSRLLLAVKAVLGRL